MRDVSADRNLLLGVLALQREFVSRDDLVAAMNAWVQQSQNTLGEILLEQGAVSRQTLSVLEDLVQQHLQDDGNHDSTMMAATAVLPAVSPLKASGSKITADTTADPTLTLVAPTRPGAASHNPKGRVSGTAASVGQRFRVLRRHAKGGLGEVFVAQDQELLREVALKEIQHRFADQTDSRSRFLLEAEITGALEHPGIVPVYSLGQYSDGRPYYAMRFIRGVSLQEAIDSYHQTAISPSNTARSPAPSPDDRSPDGDGMAAGAVSAASTTDKNLELRKLLARFIDVCNAIQYAHSRGVLHRDLKPANVMLGQYGETLVVDWGLAKTVGQTEAPAVHAQPLLSPSSSGSVAATMMGSAMGTPQFMSPEQAAGRLDQLGPASDVYSLGATLYYLLTGRPPMQDKNLGELLQKVQRGEFPPPRQVLRSVPPALEAICLKAMALRPEDRYNSARALADDLEQWLADEPVRVYREPAGERLARWVRRNRSWAQAAAAALLIIAAVSVIAVVLINAQRRVANDQRQIAQSLAVEKQEMAVAERELRKQAQWQAVNLQVEQDLNRCAHEDVAAGVLALAHTLNATVQIEAPDLEQLVRGQLTRWSAYVHPLDSAYEHPDGVRSVAVSPDGSLMATGAGNVVRLWDLASGRQIASPMEHQGLLTAISFSPDGAGLLVVNQARMILECSDLSPLSLSSCVVKRKSFLMNWPTFIELIK